MAVSDLPLGFQFLTSARIPPELILQTIQHLPFGNGKKIEGLRNAHSRLRDIFDTYEHSLTRWFMEKELRHASSDFVCDKSFDLKWLGQCVEKYDIVDAVMDELAWEENCVGVPPHNVSLVNTGMLLLYRLISKSELELKKGRQNTFVNNLTEDHDDRIKFINSLQRDPLVAIYLALHHATLTARYHGRGWIHQRTYSRRMDANQLSLRNELEFCFAEASLSVGPQFIYDMLIDRSGSIGETTLLNFYHEHGTHDWVWPCPKGDFEPPRTQGPRKEPGSEGKALFTTLLERLAELEKCTYNEVRSRIEDQTDVQYHPLAYLDLCGKEQLLKGLNLE